MRSANDIMRDLRLRAEKELTGNIEPFWTIRGEDKTNGGFIGRMSSDGTVDGNAPKGLVLNTRILWTFSALYAARHEPDQMRLAGVACDTLTKWFRDTRHEGFYWLLDSRGEPLDDKKRLYGQAFAIYAFSEYAAATGSRDALETARSLFQRIDRIAHDGKDGGYFETFDRNWTPAADRRLSGQDLARQKSMNTHLHLLEAFTGLYRVSPDRILRNRIRELLDIFLTHILHPREKQFVLFFDEDWSHRSDIISWGHDIEGSWLLAEAAHALHDRELVSRVERESVAMVDRILDTVLVPSRGLPYEGKPGMITEPNRHWWPQAEAAVGLFNAWQITGDEKYLEASASVWEFIEKYIVDREHGEWHSKVAEDGAPDLRMPKVSEWKGPYHNSRACLEIMKRAGR